MKKGIIRDSASMLFPYRCLRLLGSLGRGSWFPKTISSACSLAAWTIFTGICSTFCTSGSKAALTCSWSACANWPQCRRIPNRKSSSVFLLWPLNSCSTLLAPSIFKSASLRSETCQQALSQKHKSHFHPSTSASCCPDKRCKYLFKK